MGNDDANEAFERLAARLDYAMLIVTATSDAGRAGCLVGFASQCSISPARFMVFISNKNLTYRVAREASELAVHVIPAGALDLARLFGEETGDAVDKFARCRWTETPLGTHVLEDCPDRFVGPILSRVDVGDHSGFLIEPTDVGAGDGRFLMFHEVQHLEPGHDA
ncbi:MAG: flavin reductase family protein [Actinomycetota bacterium]